MKVKSLSCVRLFAAPWTVAYQAPPSMGFSRQEYWSGVPLPSPGDLPNPRIKLAVSYVSCISRQVLYHQRHLWFMKVKSETLVSQLSPTLCDPTDCSLPGSSVHGIFQARVLEWVPLPPPEDRPNPGIEHRRQTLHRLSHQK